jgi:hypothetical protein
MKLDSLCTYTGVFGITLALFGRSLYHPLRPVLYLPNHLLNQPFDRSKLLYISTFQTSMPGLSHNSMAAILKLAYRSDAFHNFVSFVVYDGVNLSNKAG